MINSAKKKCKTRLTELLTIWCAKMFKINGNLYRIKFIYKKKTNKIVCSVPV